MIFTWILYLFISIQEEIPFKSKEEFDIKLNYTFKQRPPSEYPTFRFEAQTKDSENQNVSSMLPYLILTVKIVKAPVTEVRLKVVDNLSNKSIAKKVHDGFEFQIDMGFTDDVKDHVTANEYTVYMLNEKHQKQTKIIIFVKDDGTFLVNDEVRGKL